MTSETSILVLRALPSEPPACATVGDLAFATGLDDRQIGNAVQVLRGRGFLEILKPGCYLITSAGRDWLTSGAPVHSGQGVKPRRQARGIAARAWWVMRCRPVGITLNGLLATVATGADKAARGTLARYLTALELTGYLERTGHGDTGGYNLVRDSGPLPPVFRRLDATVHDPNNGVARPLDPGAQHD